MCYELHNFLYKICHAYKFHNFARLVHHFDIVTPSGPIPVCTDCYDVDVMSMISNQSAPLAVHYVYENKVDNKISYRTGVLDLRHLLVLRSFHWLKVHDCFCKISSDNKHT